MNKEVLRYQLTTDISIEDKLEYLYEYLNEKLGMDLTELKSSIKLKLDLGWNNTLSISGDDSLVLEIVTQLNYDNIVPTSSYPIVIYKLDELLGVRE